MHQCNVMIRELARVLPPLWTSHNQLYPYRTSLPHPTLVREVCEAIVETATYVNVYNNPERNRAASSRKSWCIKLKRVAPTEPLAECLLKADWSLVQLE